MALWISHFWNTNKKRTIYLGAGISIPVLLFLMFLSGVVKPLFINNTDKYLIEESEPLAVFALSNKTYSSQFYSKGEIEKIDTILLKKMIKSKTPFKIIIENADSVTGTYNDERIDFITNANRLTRVNTINFLND